MPARRRNKDPIGRDVSQCGPDIQSQELMTRELLPTGRQVEGAFDSKSLNKRDSSVIYTNFEFQNRVIFSSCDRSTWLKTYLTCSLEKESQFTRVGITKCRQCESHLIDLVNTGHGPVGYVCLCGGWGGMGGGSGNCVQLLYLVWNSESCSNVCEIKATPDLWTNLGLCCCFYHF